MTQNNSGTIQENPFFSSNLKLLKLKDPLLYEKILKAGSAEVKERLFDKGQILSLTISGKGEQPLVFQSKKSDQNVLRLTSYKDLKDYEVVVIEGFGLGEHVQEIIEASADSTFILVIEQNVEFFKEIINYIDLKPFLLERVCLSVNELPFQATRKRLEDYFGVYTIKDINIFRNPASIELAPEYYDKIDRQLETLSEVAKQNEATLKKFSGIWQRHILSNLKSVVIEPGINELFNKFQGIPAIIVSAGPSLDKNIHWISGAKGKAIILAVDTAYKSLLKYGIEPDFVVSLDALEANYRHLEGIKGKETCLIANPVAYPSIIKEYQGPVFIMNFGDPLMFWIENCIGKKGETLSGGSIATAVFDLAHKLGSSPVILVGQDLSYPGGRAYSEWCYFDQIWLDQVSQHVTIDDLHITRTFGDRNLNKKGIFGEDIHTSLKMVSWKTWFEAMIKQNATCCIDATEDGLEIRGAEMLPLKEAINKYCLKRVEPKKVISEIKSTYQTTDIPTFIKQLEELKTKIARVGYIGKEGKNVSSVVLNISENSPQQQIKLNSYLQKMNVFAEQILNETEFIEMNKWCIETLLNKMKTEDKSKEKNKDASSIMLQNVRSFNVLFEGIDEMCSHYDNKLDNAIVELNGLL